MERAQNKASRLIQIENLLLAHPEGLTQAEIARRLQVNRSTILRYQPDLPRHIYIEDDGRWKLDRTADLINVRLNLHEALALHLAARLLATRMDRQNPHAASALRKMGCAMQRWAARISKHVLQSADVMDEAAQRHDPAYLRSLEQLTLAWAEQRKVQVWHRSEKTAKVYEYLLSPYFIEPYAVGQTTHVIGLSEPRLNHTPAAPGRLRTLKIERIERAEITREPYEIPPDFDPRGLLADAWGIWYTEDEPVEVSLKFHPRVAQRVRETRWHRSQQQTELPDGSLLWKAKVAEIQEMLPWIRGWGADVEVLEPEGLRKTLEREARRLARLYGAVPTERQLLDQILLFWGKTANKEKNTSNEFHPALWHMVDVGQIAQALLGENASPRWRKSLATLLNVSDQTLSGWLPWFVSLHDIGKISAAFQSQNSVQFARLKSEGVPFSEKEWNGTPHHRFVAQYFLKNELAMDLPDTFRQVWHEVVAGHHGQFAAPDSISETYRLLRSEPPEWAVWRKEAADFLKAHLAKSQPESWPQPENISAAIMALTGFTILCDWIGSDSNYFPMRPDLSPEEYLTQSEERAIAAVKSVGFTQAWHSDAPLDFAALFPEQTSPRPLQQVIDQIPPEILSQPCLAIVEAPTGEGKTEAALTLAHRLAAARDTDELYYALPTTATSNQMYSRLQRYLQQNLGLQAQFKLIHGQAFLYEDALRLEAIGNENGQPNLQAQEWFGPKKRALLASFGVGTVDQIELAALNTHHNALRMIGLAGKVVILDEIHAYDIYMTTIIERLLNWLSALGTSVILLSATLPKSRRAALIRAYGLAGSNDDTLNAYPSLWVGSQAGIFHDSPSAYQPERWLYLDTKTLHFDDEDTESKAAWLLKQVDSGGCACWITNTVARAQKLYEIVDRQAVSDVDRTLLHSQFPLEQRRFIELQIAKKYGPPSHSNRPVKGIVIGTQVLEQSLDLDFDVMASDLAPVDLLLQRAGRLHRHNRKRPEQHRLPRLWLNCALDDQGEPMLAIDNLIYSEFILRQTWSILNGRNTIVLPADYRPLVEAVYGVDKLAVENPLKRAWDELKRAESNAAGKARTRLTPLPDREDSFTGPASQLTFEEDENSAGWVVAQTRLGEESLNVVPLERAGNLAWFVHDGERIQLHLDQAAKRETQLQLLQHSLRISNKEAIKAIQNQADQYLPKLFSESTYLRTVKPLWLENNIASIQTDKAALLIRLDAKLGLIVERQKGVR